MNMMSTKLQIYEYLKKKTTSFNANEIEYYTTSAISDNLSISRSLTSQYLNELCKEESLIKVNTRPVYYFDKKALENKYQCQFRETEFYNMNDLVMFLDRKSFYIQDFKKAIGSDGSLNYSIEQMKSAIFYPPNGLPVLLCGTKGSGKAYLAKLLYEFGINRQLLGKNAPFIRVRIKKDDKSITEELFGSSKNEGILTKNTNGVIYLSDIENMSVDLQDKLSDYLSKGQHTPVGDVMKNTPRPRVILGINESLSSLNENLLLNLPVKCNVPSLDSRSEEEKEAFIVKFFKLEANRMEKEIMISNSLFQILLKYHFANSITELRNCIKTICANAYLECMTNQHSMSVYLLHLPTEMLAQIKLNQESTSNSDEIINICEYKRNSNSDRIILFFDHIIDSFIEYQNSSLNFYDFQKQTYQWVRDYYDFIVFEEKVDNSRLKVIEKLVNEVLDLVKSENNITLPLNCGFVLSRIIYSISRNNSTIQCWENERHGDIKNCLSLISMKLENEYYLAQNIIKQINQNLDIKLGDLNLIFLMFNISFYNQNLQNQDIRGIIISHGYSTATSIADAANHLLEYHVFEALDMPLDVTFMEIEKQLNEYINLHPNYKNLIMMVDMGSLEEIGAHIHANLNIGVINNISTGLALDIGNQILQHKEIGEILMECCEKSACRYQLFNRLNAEKAIVFTNDAGIKVSGKLAELFKQSLPRMIPLKFIEYDYERLLNHKESDVLFEKYEVILLVKPYTLKIPNYNSVTLEDIISFKEINKVNLVLSEYFTASEIDQFNSQLLKNFSLQSIMENLTVLNPSKLLDFVDEAVNNLQRCLQRKFQSKTIVGINIHISFLIERLLTKSAIESNEDLSEFILLHQDFINNVLMSFEVMLRHYNVQLPTNEILYLYDYILND